MVRSMSTLLKITVSVPRVPHLEDACGNVPYKYDVRCTFAVAGPEEAFASWDLPQ